MLELCQFLKACVRDESAIDVDVLHADARAGDARLAAADTGLADDALGPGVAHIAIIPPAETAVKVAAFQPLRVCLSPNATSATSRATSSPTGATTPSRRPRMRRSRRRGRRSRRASRGTGPRKTFYAAPVRTTGASG